MLCRIQLTGLNVVQIDADRFSLYREISQTIWDRFSLYRKISQVIQHVQGMFYQYGFCLGWASFLAVLNSIFRGHLQAPLLHIGHFSYPKMYVDRVCVLYQKLISQEITFGSTGLQLYKMNRCYYHGVFYLFYTVPAEKSMSLS